MNLIRYRRTLGLFCFYYVLFHFTAYLVLDQKLVLHAVIAAVVKRPFIMLGMAGLALLVSLAITSNSFSIGRLGKNRIRLHRLIFVVALCGGTSAALSPQDPRRASAVPITVGYQLHGER